MFISIAQHMVLFSVATGAQSVGHYAAGHLQGGVALPVEGPDHYRVLVDKCYVQGPRSRYYSRPERAFNYYGHPEIVGAVQDVARQIRLQHIGAPRIAFGELSNRRGDRIPGHMSHRNGLDVDIFYLQRPMAKGSHKSPIPACSEGPRFEVKRDGQWQLREDFELAWNWTLASKFAARKDVQIIFIGGVVRKALAKWARTHVSAAQRRRTLKKLRATWCRPPKGVQMGTYRNNYCPHDDHIHVRFRCPKGSLKCRSRR